MSLKSGLQPLLLATGSFIGGVTLALLMAPNNGRKNRKWISSQASEMGNWVTKQRNTAHQTSQNELFRIRQHLHHGLKRNIPDLYEATEDIDSGDQHLIGA